MSVIAANPMNNYQGWTQMNNFPNTAVQNQGAVAITTPQGRQIYNYPQTSLYNDPNKQAGLNIYVFNPSGNSSNYNTCNNVPQSKEIASSPIANTPITDKNSTDIPVQNKKTKKITKLTNDYIKTLESFLKSKDDSVRKQGIQDLIKRFEEDEKRYDNLPLTALLNIALQDPNVHNRMMASSVIASGGAHGDKNTIQILRELVNSDKMYGQEAKLASEALLNTSKTKETVEDTSSKDIESGNKEKHA